MQKLVTRHQQSVINVFEEISSGGEEHPPALHNLNAELTEHGVIQAEKWGRSLWELGVDKNEPIAVSEFRRTIQTAEAAGFKNIVIYAVLNEILRDDPERVVKDVIHGILPPEAYDRAKQIRNNPPKERLWIAHGLVIAGLRRVLSPGQHYKRLVPLYGQTTVLEI